MSPVRLALSYDHFAGRSSRATIAGREAFRRIENRILHLFVMLGRDIVQVDVREAAARSPDDCFGRFGEAHQTVQVDEGFDCVHAVVGGDENVECVAIFRMHVLFEDLGYVADNLLQCLVDFVDSLRGFFGFGAVAVAGMIRWRRRNRSKVVAAGLLSGFFTVFAIGIDKFFEAIDVGFFGPSNLSLGSNTAERITPAGRLS